jgi:serine/threonine protein kinase/tetratricopeptide (TPR) repeat protein
VTTKPPGADEVFAAALGLPEAERAAFVAGRCEGAVREEVMSLLGHHATAGAGFMRPMPPAGRIGRFKLVRPLGQGGFGAVYLAEQEEPVRRLVALKVLHAGLDAAEIVARFEAERQALAVMDHPGIAKVFDAGATADGRPYFAMEYVRAEPITNYCKRQPLSTRRRLELFTQVCDAVQHAHMKGVIHRDIKASNVLVEEDEATKAPRVRVIDFGIAKATQGPLTDRTLVTQRGELMGTPEYMSPEQASGLDVDTRADVYSLGVLLYELLTGTLPFDPKELRSKSYGEIERTIREVEPPRPSARADDPSLAGDLDWVVMRCLEKERSRRYATPAEIADDVHRFLRHEPVVARPPSTAYRLSKFARRNRFALAAAASIATALIIGTVASTVGFIQAGHQRDEAEHQGRVSRGVVSYVTGELLRQADPAKSAGKDITVKDVLKNADATIADKFKEDPLVEAGIRVTVGEMEQTLSEFALAQKHLQRAVDLRLRELGPRHADTLDAQRELAVMYDIQGKHEPAADLFEVVLRGRAALFGGNDTRTLQAANDLAVAYDALGRYADAERFYRQAFEARRQAQGADVPDAALVENNLAVNLWHQGRYTEALPLAEHACATYRAAKGADHPVSLSCANALAMVELRLGNLARAHTMLTENLERRRRVLGNDSPYTATSMSNLGECLLEEDPSGNAPAAEVILRESLVVRERQLPAGHWSIASTQSLLGQALAVQRKSSEAEPLLHAGYDGLLASKQTPPGLADLAAKRLAQFYREQGNRSLADEWDAKAEGARR